MGFGPKLPFSAHALELADLEAAFVGNLARYCIHMGTVPRFPLRGLWWVNGECKGLSVTGWGDEADQIKPLINHLVQYAPFIVGTEGAQDLLEAGAATRWYSKKMFPQETGEWVTLGQACEITGRKPYTVNQWRLKGWVKTLDDSWGVMFSRVGLETVKTALEGKRTANLPKAIPVL